MARSNCITRRPSIGFAIAALAALAMLASGCETNRNANAFLSADRTVRVVNHDPKLRSQQLERLAGQAAREYTALRRAFGKDVGRITVEVRDRGVGRHFPPATIHIPSRLIRKSRAITAHEITHLLAQGWTSLVLKEGLAVYAQARFGEQRGWPNYGRPIHRSARRWRNTPNVGVRTPADAEFVWATARRRDTEARRAAYAIAGSWVTWIVEEKLGGDLGRFMERLYRTGDYPAALGQPQAALAREWGEFVEAAGSKSRK
ncbi:MAG: hypothetical protein QF654_14180 [Alphaproteobacteria bacterium]|jgi:hypothetical protein|nr:hypothetical protein [Alphaproteobacteria bacterium]